jgi:hypothetical protein
VVVVDLMVGGGGVGAMMGVKRRAGTPAEWQYRDVRPRGASLSSDEPLSWNSSRASSDSAVEDAVVLDHYKLARIPTYGHKKAYFERFVVKVAGNGFAMATIEGGCRMLKSSTLEKEFAASGVVDGDGKPISFITRWLADPDQRSVANVTYMPYPVPVLPGHFNVFRGFGRNAQLVAGDARRVRHLVRPWRLIGVGECAPGEPPASARRSQSRGERGARSRIPCGRCTPAT